MEQVDATIEVLVAALSELLEGELLPDAKDNTAEDTRNAEGGL